MIAAVRSAWALFFGLLLIMTGNGLQSALLGVRAELEGFGASVTGLVMTGYFVGFLGGSRLVPLLIERVGHVRTFAALASLSSISILLHPVFVEPSVWIAMRFLTGVSYAGLYIVCESWLNERATNETRGQLLAAYMITMMGGVALGSLLLGTAEPARFELFVLISVLLSAAVIPILLSAAPAPVIDRPETMSIRRLYRFSPLGVVGAFFIGTSQGLFFGMGAVYATRAGLSVGETSIFMMMAFLGAIILTWPIGRLSDILDRRLVITGVTFAAAAAATAGAFLTGGDKWPLFIAMALFGGCNQPLYSLCIAHTNDYLTPQQMVKASGTLVLVGGIGAIAGPMMAAGAMDLLGAWGYFWGLAALHALLGAFALYRMRMRAATPNALQGAYVAMPASSTPVTGALHPEFDWPEGEAEPEDVDDLPLHPDEGDLIAVGTEDDDPDDRPNTPLRA